LLLPNLCDFYSKYPDIELVMGMSDRPVDLVQEAVDCVIRVGDLQDSSMVARRIGTFQAVTCGAPLYFERYGMPHTIEDLQSHQSVHYFSSRTGRTIDWDFVVDGAQVEVKMAGKLSVNDGDAYVASALQGFGLVQAPKYMILPYLEDGRLVEILAQWQPVPMPISVVYLHNRHLSPKVRAFVDWVAELFATCPLQRGCQQDIETQECRFATKPESNTIRAVIEQNNIAESVF
jgi:LysR family transcriptional regulator for bpeEF and oprC